jgi:hypothetical protein
MYLEYTLSGYQPRQTEDAATAQPLASGMDPFGQFRPYLSSPCVRVTSALLAASLGWACITEWREPHPHMEPNSAVTVVHPAPLFLNGSVSGYVSGTYVLP